MALGTTANAIDAEYATIETQVAAMDAANAAIAQANQNIADLKVDLDADIRLANTEGAGSIPAGFLDSVGAGQIVNFEFSNVNRRLTFTYNKDLDELSNIEYLRKDRTLGTL